MHLVSLARGTDRRKTALAQMEQWRLAIQQLEEVVCISQDAGVIEGLPDTDVVLVQ